MRMATPIEILLVEDNEGDVEMTRRALRNDEFTCRISVANDGVDALNFLRKQEKFSGAPKPHLILLDLNMPRMDGKQFLENAKADPALKAIPVVMLTSSQSPNDVRECYERHANCYVVKPFNGKEFADTVRQIVSFWSSLAKSPY